jgi:hypothetical protein
METARTGLPEQTGMRNVSRYRMPLLCLLFATLLGCTVTPLRDGPRSFSFGQDSLAFANELTWVYGFDEAGRWRGEPREPAPEYTLHCFVVALTARQFLYHARFDASIPAVDERQYRDRVHEVLSRNARTPSPPDTRVIIPGYADLNTFSARWEVLLKQEGGGAWQSYLQRGNWRMVFPFSRDHQAATAAELRAALRHQQPPIVHVVRFPSRWIDHAVLIYDATEVPEGVRFSVYDPNDPKAATALLFDKASRTFNLPRNQYFFGGPVDVYQVYRGWFF